MMPTIARVLFTEALMFIAAALLLATAPYHSRTFTVLNRIVLPTLGSVIVATLIVIVWVCK